jgi:hypothetical protein
MSPARVDIKGETIMAANIHIHPAPGLGELMPGWFAVPQNPIDFAKNGVSYTPGIGDILPASFVVPQNPIMDYVNGNVKLIGQGSGAPKGGNVGTAKGSGMGCGCGGTCGGCGGGSGHNHGTGMGDISTDFSNMVTDITTGNFTQFGTDFLTLIQEPTIAGIPLWGLAIGLYLAYDMISSHGVTVSKRR